MKRDEKIVWSVVVGLIIFWIIAIPAIMKGPKLAGAGPQPSSDGGGAGA